MDFYYIMCRYSIMWLNKVTVKRSENAHSQVSSGRSRTLHTQHSSKHLEMHGKANDKESNLHRMSFSFTKHSDACGIDFSWYKSKTRQQTTTVASERANYTTVRVLVPRTDRKARSRLRHRNAHLFINLLL